MLHKIFFMLNLMFSVFSAFQSDGQVRLGSTANDIRQEFKNPKYHLESGFTDDYTYYISIETDRALVIYYFNDERICNACAVIPYNEGSLNFYVEYYNEHYVILSPTRWRMYSENGYCDIELIFTDEGKYYFIWY